MISLKNYTTEHKSHKNRIQFQYLTSIIYLCSVSHSILHEFDSTNLKHCSAEQTLLGYTII